MPHRRNRKTRVLYERNRKTLLARPTSTACHYCRRFISTQLPKGHPLKATADHVVPCVWGGTDDLSNLVPACGECNSRRGDMPYADFVRLIDGELVTDRHSREW